MSRQLKNIITITVFLICIALVNIAGQNIEIEIRGMNAFTFVLIVAVVIQVIFFIPSFLLKTVKTYSQKDTIFDILKSYSEIRNRNYVVNWSPKPLPILSIEDARKRLETMLGISIEWMNFLDFIPSSKDSGERATAYRRSSAASIFNVSLEMSKKGLIEINQNKNFGTIRFKNIEKEENKNSDDIYNDIAQTLLSNGSKSDGLLEKAGVIDPHSGSIGKWTPAVQFNLMFKTDSGPSEKTGKNIYLRPETAQGIFINYLLVQNTMRLKSTIWHCANW